MTHQRHRQTRCGRIETLSVSLLSPPPPVSLLSAFLSPSRLLLYDTLLQRSNLPISPRCPCRVASSVATRSSPDQRIDGGTRSVLGDSLHSRPALRPASSRSPADPGSRSPRRKENENENAQVNLPSSLSKAVSPQSETKAAAGVIGTGTQPGAGCQRDSRETRACRQATVKESFR